MEDECQEEASISTEEEKRKQKILMAFLLREIPGFIQFIKRNTPYGEESPSLVLGEEMKFAEAHANIKRNVIVYSARLAIGLRYEEIEAIIAHELGHIIKRNTRSARLRAFLDARVRTGIFLYYSSGIALTSLLPPVFVKDWFFFSSAFLACAFFLTMLDLLSIVAFFAAARREEYNADKYAASITCPGILARALVKIRNINGIERLSACEEFFNKHPRMARRLRYLRRWRDEKNARKCKKSENMPEQ